MAPADRQVREWNPLWRDPEDPAHPGYLAAIKRIIMASINWIEAHPNFKPAFREPNKREVMRQAGVSDDMPEDSVAIAGPWEEWFQPMNAHTREWFRVMSDAGAGGKAAPTVIMLGKGVAAGLLLLSGGWDAFDKFMLEPGDDTSH